MRAIVALCVGLVSLLGVGAAPAGVGLGECGVCECQADGRRLCMQDGAVSTADCIEFCGSTNVIDFSAGIILCSDVPGCAHPSTTSAPAASPYGIAAVLIGICAVGLWRLRSQPSTP